MFVHARASLLTVGLLTTACGSPASGIGQASPASNAEAFGGVQCTAVRPQTEPDLMGWDPASRLNLSRLKSQGVVAVRYEAEGCNVKLELLSNCIGQGAYEYTPYSANEHKIARDANELFAQLPIGAASLTGKVKGTRALRTDYVLVGQHALPPSTSIRQADLKGADCARATHVVSAVYVGGFALVSGEERQLDATATVFGIGGGGSLLSSAERIADEGDAEACKEAQRSHKALAACSVPLRVGLLALASADAAAPPKTGVEARKEVVRDRIRMGMESVAAMKLMLATSEGFLTCKRAGPLEPAGAARLQAEIVEQKTLLSSLDRKWLALMTQSQFTVGGTPPAEAERALAEQESVSDEVGQHTRRARTRLSLLTDTLVSGTLSPCLD